MVLYRIFNFSPTGYVIVTADDIAEPLIGYGLSSNFSFDNAPPALLYLLGEYKQEMEYIVKNKLKADDSINAKWRKFSSEDYVPLKSYTVGTELLVTNWDQGSPYNNSCPLDPNTGYRCLAGCTAVALGQILNYWNCKVFPDGTRTYYPNIYFTNPLTVNFYDQDYDWGNIGEEVTPTADFLYHCGVAIRVNYTDSATSGYSSYVEYAMENNFGLQTSGLKSKNSYLSSTWINMLKADIDAGRPIYYDGTNTTVTPNVAHAWVIDGYKATNEFHCNWGWGGNNNDFYYLTDLTPGSHNYNSNQNAILGVEPVLDACVGIPGTSTVCSSNVSYSVSIPSTASVVWSKSFNLDQVGGNTGTTYIVNEGSSGSGYVTATIKNSHDITFLTRTKTVWAGAPDLDNITVYYTDDLNNYGEYCPGDANELLARANPSIDMGLTSIYWDMGSWDVYSYDDEGYVLFEIPLSFSGSESVYYEVSNACDVAITSETIYEGYCGGYFMVIAPNPALEETILTIETTSEAESFDENLEWELEVYDQKQLLKTKSNDLRGKSAKIQTSAWKEGVYVVRVNYKDKVLQGKLIVKK